MPNGMEINEEEKKKRERELNKLIAELRNIRGSGTELISLYIPDGYPIHEITNKLNSEYSQAGNIKSKTTRKNVQGAIEKILNYLKIFKSTPKNGIAIFCGNISQDPSKVDIELFSIVPPYPIQVQIYRCDSTFLLEPLELLKGKKEKYGLVAISGDEATIGILDGNVARVIKKIQSFGPRKTHKGGSCIHEDAKVQLENGLVIRIADVREGDKILSYSFEEEKPIFAECKKVMKRTADVAYRIITKHPRTEIIATKEHIFFVRGPNGVEEKFVEDLKLGDTLMYETGSTTIVKIEKIKPKGHFYDLSIPKTESFIVNGLVVHNSAARYQRFVEEKIEEFYKRVGDAMNEILLANGIKKVVIGGPGPAKEDFLKLRPFNYQFEVLGVISMGYSDEYGIDVLKEKSFELIGEKRTLYEKELINRFLREVVKDGLAVYGIDDTKKALEEGKVDILLLSEGVRLKRVVFECERGHREEAFMEEEELKRLKKVFCECGAEKKVVEEKDVFNELFDLAESLGIKVEVVSADTQEGAQFLGGFKGIGALLKFK